MPQQQLQQQQPQAVAVMPQVATLGEDGLMVEDGSYAAETAR